jgi:hypothetical protein
VPSSDQLWDQGITVNGTISDPADYTVWVNGTKAALNGDLERIFNDSIERAIKAGG